MAKSYHVLSDGNQTLPVADGSLETGLMDSNLETGVFVIQFYDAAGDPVTPGAGTIVPEMSPFNGNQWHAPSSGDATINAVDVVAGAATYTIPVFNGPGVKGRLTFDGITAAVSAKAYFWRA